jgi:hypothetical protein
MVVIFFASMVIVVFASMVVMARMVIMTFMVIMAAFAHQNMEFHIHW